MIDPAEGQCVEVWRDIDAQRETEEKARQPETKSGAIAHTSHKSKATQRNAEPNKKPQTHTLGAKQAQTTSVEGQAKTRIGVRPAACVATYAPDQHRDALPWHTATLSSRSAPEM
jgi:hypothetical protein